MTRKNVFPAKPKYNTKTLKQSASYLKKQLGSKAAVSKMNKSQLINFLSDHGYPLSEVATFSKVKIPKRNYKTISKARRNVFPAKPKYNTKTLKQSASYLKKQLGSKAVVSKMNKSQLINFLSDHGYPLSEVATFSKIKIPQKRGQKPKDYAMQVQNKMSAMNAGNSMVNDLFSSALSQIPEKRPRGRPKKVSSVPSQIPEKRPVGRPKKVKIDNSLSSVLSQIHKTFLKFALKKSSVIKNTYL